MKEKIEWMAACFSGFIGVMAGAFGAHGLQGTVSGTLFHAWETAVRYQMWHTLAIMLVLVWRQQYAFTAQRIAVRLWMAGTVLFSGSLYALTLGAPAWLGPVTPIGGALLIVGWLVLAWGIFRQKRH